jgi:hypothetical protein
MRDVAIKGLVALVNRQEWRDSEAGPSIEASVSAALHDTNPVMRMLAAGAARALHASADSAQRAAAIGELLLAEDHPIVRASLLDQLCREANQAPETVDGLLERLLEEGGDAFAEPDGDFEHGVLDLLSYLALIPQTTFASQTVERWCTNAPAHAACVEAFAQSARDALAPPGGPEQQTAFRLLTTAATASLARFTRDPDEHLASADLPEDRRAELDGAVTVAHSVAEQIYFASGAFDEKQGHGRVSDMDLHGFADLAFPLLTTCAKLRFPQSVHEAVQTMIFLAPLDEARALQAIAAAVPADGPYAGDTLAGDTIIPYLERLLTEHRQLVLYDNNGVAAFRHLLATFAAAGNQAALALAYTFADVFR